MSADHAPRIRVLPMPLAQILERALNAKSAVELHHCAYFLVEAGVKLATAARLGLWASQGPGSPELDASIGQLTQASAGHWRGLLRQVDAALARVEGAAGHPLVQESASWPARRLPAAKRFVELAVAREALGPTSRRHADRVDPFLDALIAYRNEVIGHGAQRQDAFYAELGPALLDAAMELLQGGALLGSMALATGSGSSEGWTPLFGAVAPAGVREGVLHLVGRAEPIPLHPYLVWRAADGEPGRVVFLNKVLCVRRSSGLEVRRATYLDYATGTARDDTSAHEALGHVLRGGAQSPDEAPSGPADGSRRIGDFELLEPLGRGGMGVVWKARQGGLGRIVALKVLTRELAEDPVARDRFDREIRALGRSDHPNVVRILSHGVEGSEPYYAMEFVDGGDLASAETRARLGQGPRRYATLAARFAEVADGLQHLHDLGVLHRDLKPANLMATRDGGRVAIADLGLALLDDASRNLTGTHVAVLGTLRYMPPEQLLRDRALLDARADVYALGVTLTELCTGKPYFDGDSDERLMHQVLHVDPPAPSQLAPDLPHELELVLLKATAKRADDRYPDARAFGADLAAFAEDRPVSVRPVGWVRGARMALRREPVVAAYLKAAGVVFGGALLLSAVWLGFSDSFQGNRTRHYAGLSARWAHHVGDRWLPVRSRVNPVIRAFYDLLDRRTFDPEAPRAHVRVTYEGGLPVRVEGIGADGLPRRLRSSPPRIDQAFDGQGRAVQVVESDGDRELARHGIAWIDERSAHRDFQDERGAALWNADRGLFAERVVFDERGVEVGWTGLDLRHLPMADARGRWAVRREVDAFGHPVLEESLDRDGGIMADDRGVATTRIRRRASLPVAWTLLDAAGGPAVDGEGVHAWAGDFAVAWVRPLSAAQVEALGSALGEAGLSELRRRFASSTLETREGPPGGPDPDCPRRLVIQDDAMAPLARVCVDGEGRPVEDSRGVALTVFEGAGADRERELRFDAAGRPLAPARGAAVVHTVRELGRPVLVEGLDGEGRPARLPEGHARWTATRDAHGQPLHQAWFDVDGAPWIDPETGCSALVRTYGETGRIASSTCWAGEALSPHTDGPPSWRAEYDARGRLARRTALDADGRPAPWREGWTTEEFTRPDEHAEIVRYRALDDRLLALPAGWAREVRTFDAAGRLVRRCTTDLAEVPVADAAGCACRAFGYDAGGRRESEACEGASGGAGP